MTPSTFVALSAVANTGTGPVSAVYDANFVQFVSAFARFSDSAAAGSLRIEQSNDPASPPASTSWAPVAASAFAVTAGGTAVTPVTQVCARWYRVAFARTAGAGAVTAYVHAQGDAS